jgi:hypothetical protein
MKKLFQAIGLTLLLVVNTYYASANTSVDIQKNSIDQTRSVAGFSGVSSSGSYNVFITIGNTESLRLEGKAEVISEIQTKVENGILKISKKRTLSKMTWKNTERVDIYIEAKTLHSLTLIGSGDIQVTGLVNATKLANTISGSGNISLEMDVKNYVALISGSGEIKVSGKSDNTSVTIAGSGDFNGAELESELAKARISGSGDIVLTVNKDLDALISGSGNIKYGGNPNVKYSKSGSGNISKL